VSAVADERIVEMSMVKSLIFGSCILFSAAMGGVFGSVGVSWDLRFSFTERKYVIDISGFVAMERWTYLKVRTSIVCMYFMSFTSFVSNYDFICSIWIVDPSAK